MLISRIDEDQIANAMLTESFDDYNSGQYSPQYLSSSQLEPGTIITTEEDDAKRLAFARMQVQGTGSSVQVHFFHFNAHYILLIMPLFKPP